MAEMQKIQFTRVPGEAPAADSLRLMRDKGGVLLVVSRTTPTPPLGANTVFSAFAPASPGAPWSVLAQVHEVVPAQPAWDVAAGPDGRPEIVYEKPGGAINALILRNAAGETQPVSAAYPLQSFSAPRFARPSGVPPAWLTAIADNRTCVAFPPAGSAAYHSLGECAEGLLVKTGVGFVYLCKTRVPGPVRGNLLSPGRIHIAALDAELRPAGPPVQLFGGIVYEFDADIIQGRLVVLATTPKGVMIAAGPAQGQATRLTSLEHALPVALTSPAIVAGPPGKAYLAALDAARVVTAEIPVP